MFCAHGELGRKAHAELEHRDDAAPHGDAARRRMQDAREDLEERALAGAVAADDAEHLARRDVEAHIVERRQESACRPRSGVSALRRD